MARTSTFKILIIILVRGEIKYRGCVKPLKPSFYTELILYIFLSINTNKWRSAVSLYLHKKLFYT